MSRNPRHRHGIAERSARPAFTLIEVAAATAMGGLLLAALVVMLHTTLRMRQATGAVTDRELRLDRFQSLLGNDVRSMARPTGILAGAVTGTKEEESGLRRDHVQFSPTSGSVDDRHPWGDMMRVEYSLEETAEAGTYDLVRALTRNLLAIVAEDPEKQVLLHGVTSLELTYYDGDQWRDSWDSTAEDNQAPRAVSARIEFAPDPAVPTPSLEVVVPVIAEPASSTTSASGSNPNPSPGGGGG